MHIFFFKRWFRILLLCSLWYSFGAALYACPPGLRQIGDSCIGLSKLTKFSLNKLQRRRLCADIGGNGLTIRNPQDQKNVMIFLKHYAPSNIRKAWLFAGLVFSEFRKSIKDFTWLIDTPRHSGLLNTYLDIATDEGSFVHHKNCIAVDVDTGKWTRESCRRKYRALCVKRLGPGHRPAQPASPIYNALQDSHRNKENNRLPKTQGGDPKRVKVQDRKQLIPQLGGLKTEGSFLSDDGSKHEEERPSLQVPLPSPKSIHSNTDLQRKRPIHQKYIQKSSTFVQTIGEDSVYHPWASLDNRTIKPPTANRESLSREKLETFKSRKGNEHVRL